MAAGVLQGAVQEAVMRCGCDDELFQAWRVERRQDTEEDLPEEVVAMCYDYGPL